MTERSMETQFVAGREESRPRAIAVNSVASKDNRSRSTKETKD